MFFLKMNLKKKNYIFETIWWAQYEWVKKFQGCLKKRKFIICSKKILKKQICTKKHEFVKKNANLSKKKINLRFFEKMYTSLIFYISNCKEGQISFGQFW